MCLMITKPSGVIVPDEYLCNGFDGNPDGAGYAFINGDGMLLYRKGIFDLDEFISLYQSEVKPETHALIHFRMATHGSKSKDNCHPFDVGNNMMMAHNGIIDIKTEGDESDTLAFLRRVIQPALTLSPSLVRNQQWQADIRARISGSKLAFISARPEHSKNPFHIINEQLGTYEGGAWYSNTGYKYAYRYTPMSGGNRYWDDDETSIGKTEFVDPWEMDLECLTCDFCGNHITSVFALDRSTGLVGCGDCVSCVSGDAYRISKPRQHGTNENTVVRYTRKLEKSTADTAGSSKK